MLHRSIHMIERQMNRWPCIIEYIGYEPTNMCRSTADTLSQETMGWDALVTGHWSLVTQVVIKADISLSKPEISWNRATNRRSTLARMGLSQRVRSTEYSYRIIQCQVSFVLSYVIGNELSDFDNSKAGNG
jgi:hypothetical protein